MDQAPTKERLMNRLDILLFELRIKEDELNRLKAQDTMNRRLAAQARAQALRRGVHRMGQRWMTWLAQVQQQEQLCHPFVTPE
jgi:hypothetical protein